MQPRACVANCMALFSGGVFVEPASRLACASSRGPGLDSGGSSSTRLFAGRNPHSTDCLLQVSVSHTLCGRRKECAKKELSQRPLREGITTQKVPRLNPPVSHFTFPPWARCTYSTESTKERKGAVISAALDGG
jgi:hypothetical protein